MYLKKPSFLKSVAAASMTKSTKSFLMATINFMRGKNATYGLGSKIHSDERSQSLTRKCEL